MRLYLLRHAQTRVVDGDFFGSGLSEDGLAATRELADSGMLPKLDRILSSPYRRARETAAVLSEKYSVPVEDAPFLAEWNLQAQNLGEEAYRREEAAGWEDHSRVVAGGESLLALQQRALAGIESFARSKEGDVVLLVAHGTIIDLLCAHLAGRQAEIEDILGLEYLAFANIEAREDKLALIKDIVTE